LFLAAPIVPPTPAENKPFDIRFFFLFAVFLFFSYPFMMRLYRDTGLFAEANMGNYSKRTSFKPGAPAFLTGEGHEWPAPFSLVNY